MRSGGLEGEISKETELLLWAIRVDGQGYDQIRNLPDNGLNWSELIRLAQSHGLIPLIYHRLNNLPGIEIPPEFLKEIKGLYLVNLRRNLIHSRQLLRILQLLSEEGINVIPFKGIALAIQAYGRIELRNCGDLDILVPKEHIPQIITIFEEIGLQPDIHFSNILWPGIHASIKRSIGFTSKDFIPIDIHWGTFDIFTGFHAMKEFFENTQTIKLEGFDIPTLSLEDSLVILSVHGNKHFWSSMKWITDIVHLLKNNPNLDISLALSKAEKLNCKRFLLISLQMAQVMGGIEYGDTTQNILDSDGLSKKIARYYYNRFRFGDTTQSFSKILTMILSRERWLDRLVYGIFVLYTCTPPEGSRVRFPLLLRPLYLFVQLQ